MKRLIFLSLMIFVFVYSVPAFSYEIQITGNIPLADNLTGISINSATGIAVAVSSDAKTLYIIDTQTNSVIKKIPLDIIPSGLAIDSKKNLAIVSSKDGTLQYFDLETGDLIKTISPLSHSELNSESKAIDSIAINKDSFYISSGNKLALIDLETEKIIKEATLHDTVIGMGIDNNLGYLLMITEGKDGLSLYDAESLKPISVIETDKNPSGVAVNPSTHIAVLTNKTDDSISVISLEDKALLDTIPFEENPSAIAIDPTRNIALIAHANGIAIVLLENPVPTIDTLIPESSRAGDSGFTLSIKGSKFIRDSRAKFNLKEMSTLFEDNYNLKALIPSEELLSPGYVPVSIMNPPPGGGLSNSLIFRIINPIPQIESIKPDTVALTAPPATIRVWGKNFLNNSTVNLNGKNLKTRFISSILLEADLDLSDIKTPAKYPVTVINPIPVSFTSNVVFLNVVEDESFISSTTKEDDSKDDEAEKLTGKLTGRILNTHKEPVEGVTVQIKNIKAVTDSNGYFTLENVPSGKQHLMIHGSTAKEPDSHYPTIPLTINIMENTVNEMPFQIYLHRQKNYNFKDINLNEDTILTDPEVPDFEMRIPKGVNITGWDGMRNEKVSVRTVPIDRLPVKPLPDNAHVRNVYMFYFHKVGGGIPDQPIPIKSRNDLGLLPGEKAILWYYDESPIEGEAPNEWAIAGTGTVTPDGKYIVSDPGVGIPKFCCGATAWGGTGSGSDKSGPEGPCGQAGDPVDLATGYFMYEHTDLYMPGIIPVNIKRYYRNRESGSAVTGSEGLGAFGKGTYFEYDWWLGDYGDMLLLIKPGNYQYRFRKQPDGTFIDDSDPTMSGAVITKNADSTKTLKMRDGWTYKFDQSGKLTEISERNGNKLTFDRHSDFEGGYLRKITTQEGRTVTFNQTYTGNFFRTDSITDYTGRTVKYIYETDPFSSYPRLKQVEYPDGSNIKYGYDSSGRMNTITNQRGIVEVTNEYNSDNRIVKQTHTDGGTYLFNYTTGGGNITETAMTAPNGAVTTWRFYDDTGAYRDGYIAKKTTPDGTTIYEKEAGTNLLKSVTDPLGRMTTYTYYSNGLVQTVTDSLGNVTSYEYEANYGLPTKITDAIGQSTGKSTTFAYTFDANNRVTKTEMRDQLLNLTTVNYNTYGMPISITDPNGNPSTFLYENANKPAELTKIIDQLGNESKMAYDSLGRIERVTDANNKSTYYTYDPMDRITSVTDPIDGVTRYFYDSNGNLSMVIDAKLNMIRYEYDDRDRINKMTDQLERVEMYTYYTGTEITATTGDNLKSITDRKGQTTTFNSYDAMNRVKKITYHDGSYTDYTYDAAGRVDYINDSISGYIDYTYNDFGCTTCTGRGMDRIAQEATPLGTIDYTYDVIRRRTSMTVAGQPVVNYTYDDASRLTKISRDINGTVKDFNLSYDNASRRVQLQAPLYKVGKGRKAYWEYLTTTYGYDIANRLLNINHQGPTAIIEDLLYEYDPNGNRTKFTRNAGQPLRDAVTGASYDDANEMLTFTPATSSAKNMTYDNNGNLLTVTNSCGTTNYTWDVRNRLVGISGYKSDSSSLTAFFGYDAIGRRIQKTINGTTTQYVYDGLDIIQEIQGTAKTNYIRTLNIDEPLTRIKADGTVRHYVLDALGSVIALTDDSGVVKTTYTYDPFGNVTISGEASDNPFQYTGRENDGTGLYYYRARYYSPELQRFISEDPIKIAGGDINLYSYTWNSPMIFRDVSGLWGEDVHSGISNPDFGTYQWAIDIGLPADYAKMIAFGNNSTDSFANWALGIGVPGRHFDTAFGSVDTRDLFAQLDLDLAINLYNKGEICNALNILGQGLHSVQDKIAHGSWPFIFPHPSWFDDPIQRPAALNATEVLTKRYLLQFLAGISR